MQSDELALYLTFRFQDKEKKRASVGSAVGGGSGRRRGGGSDSAAAVLDLKRANMIGIVMSRFKLSSSAAAGGASTGQMRDVAAALREEDGSENGISLEDAQVRVSFASEWFVVSFWLCPQALIPLIPTPEESASIKDAADKGEVTLKPDAFIRCFVSIFHPVNH